MFHLKMLLSASVLSPPAQLFSEVSLDALSGSVPSSLPRLLASLQALPPAITPSHPHMAHTLTIPLLNAIISGSHGFSIGSHDLKASATSVLCKAVNSFAASYTWDSTDVSHETLHHHYVIIVIYTYIGVSSSRNDKNAFRCHSNTRGQH